jgi:hypothetical protein
MLKNGLLGALLLAWAGFAVACDDDDDDGVGLDETEFRATLEVENEVPPVTVPSDASGSAFFDVQGGSVAFQVEVEDITNVTFAHIHVGPAGVAGPFIVFLFRGAPATGDVDGQLVEGSFTADSILGVGGNPPISLDSLLVLMRNGNAYVNVHTTANPLGEIRGQIEED